MQLNCDGRDFLKVCTKYIDGKNLLDFLDEIEFNIVEQCSEDDIPSSIDKNYIIKQYIDYTDSIEEVLQYINDNSIYSLNNDTIQKILDCIYSYDDIIMILKSDLVSWTYSKPDFNDFNEYNPSEFKISTDSILGADVVDSLILRLMKEDSDTWYYIVSTDAFYFKDIYDVDLLEDIKYKDILESYDVVRDEDAATEYLRNHINEDNKINTSDAKHYLQTFCAREVK